MTIRDAGEERGNSVNLDELYKLIKNLEIIERELNSIDAAASGLHRSFRDLPFEDGGELEPLIDDLVLYASHEKASEIGFARNQLELLSRLVLFRSKYPQIRNNDLVLLTDPERMNLAERKRLKERCGIKSISEFAEEWNKTFNNMNYNMVRKKAGLQEIKK